MIYYPTRADCPNRDTLAGMTLAEALDWAMQASTHCTEVSRRAQVQTWFGLTPDQEHRAYEAVLDDLTPTVEPGADGKPQLVIPGCEHAPSATVAARRADEPMRPKAGQVHTMPERGLWGDHGQLDLF